MSLNNTIRATLLAGLIAVGSTVSGAASTTGNPLLSTVHMLVIESANVLTSVARRGLDGVLFVFRAP